MKSSSVWRRDMSTGKFILLIMAFCAVLGLAIALPWLKNSMPDVIEATENPETTLVERTAPDAAEEIKLAAELLRAPEWPEEAPANPRSSCD